MVLEIKVSTDLIIKDTDLRDFLFFGLVPECITSYVHIFFAFKKFLPAILSVFIKASIPPSALLPFLH